MRVKISVSDPWDLGEAIDWRTLPGHVVKFETIDGRETMLIRLDEPINYASQSWSYLIGVPRYSHARFSALNEGKKVPVSMTGITTQQATSDAPLASSGWRGGLAVIADVGPD